MSNRTTRQLIAAALLATACSEGAAPERLTFTRQAGDSQTAAAGTAVAVAPAVRVAGAGGNGVAGVTVAFAVASGGGAVTGATQTTNADGIAAAGAWTRGESGGPDTLTATVQNRDVDVVFMVASGDGSLHPVWPSRLRRRSERGMRSATTSTACRSASSSRPEAAA
jgi:hypothetical protein